MVLRPIEPVDQDFLDGLIVSWRLAEQYVEDLKKDSLPAERALTVLMQHDFPMLLKEIMRLRPELGKTIKYAAKRSVKHRDRQKEFRL
jgi:hypothetical protein